MLRALLTVLAIGLAGAVVAQPAQPAPKAAAKTAKSAQPAKKIRPAWAELTAEQQEILAQLKPEWDRLDHDRRLKWIGIAKRYPAMTAKQQEAVQRRMMTWAKLSPEQRRLARENYKHIAKVPAERRGDLRQQWAEYQALPLHERQNEAPTQSDFTVRHKH
jgi:Protein of unknown function (DUF3106)